MNVTRSEAEDLTERIKEVDMPFYDHLIIQDVSGPIRVCANGVFWARNGLGFHVRFLSDYGCFQPPIDCKRNSVGQS